ncbi:hypothetical protein ACFYNZ_19745 [Streptomyces kebangsaanensis]|uniref:DUF5134 domain-containing protein n=1 Tax=Streptomyces kebangsaanensis TaxID=864058 RepID=A0ABW6KUZ9_9ACTN
MHHDPYLPVAFWIAAATASTAVFLTAYIRWMPTRSTKVRVCFAPLLAGGFAFASATVKDMRPVELLSMYTLGLLGMVLGVLGRQKELARLALDQERNGRTADNRAPFGMVAQFLVAVLALGGLSLYVY